MGHWVEIGLKKLAESCAVMARHKKRLSSRSITGLVRLLCARDKLALFDHGVQLAGFILPDTYSKSA